MKGKLLKNHHQKTLGKIFFRHHAKKEYYHGGNTNSSFMIIMDLQWISDLPGNFRLQVIPGFR